jgi:hypothetical protein
MSINQPSLRAGKCPRFYPYVADQIAAIQHQVDALWLKQQYKLAAKFFRLAKADQ